VNILFMTTHLNTGGIASYLLTLTRGLIRARHHVSIVSSGGELEGRFTSLGAHCLKLSIKTKSELDLRIYLALAPLKKILVEEKIEIIHSHTRITQVMGQCARQKFGIPYVSTCHGYFRNRLSRKIASCWGDKVIAISEAVAQHLREDFHIEENRIVLIRNGIDLQLFKSMGQCERDKKRKEFKLDGGPLIGMIARLSDVKGQDILIHAMAHISKEMPQAKLLLIGKGKMEDELKNLTEKLHLRDQVIFHSTVDYTPDFLPIFDIIVTPSRQEGLGLSVLEAQAVGIPIVASNVGGLLNLIKNEETGLLVQKEDSQALATAIIRLLKDAALANKLSANAKDFVNQNYSADVMVAKTLELYQSQVGRQ